MNSTIKFSAALLVAAVQSIKFDNIFDFDFYYDKETEEVVFETT